MMVPFEMLIITNYSTMVRLRLVDTLTALFLPFTTSIFLYIYLAELLLGHTDSLLYYSARVDGANNWRYLWRIMVPMAKPALATIGLLNAIASWNSFLWPLIATNSTARRTLPLWTVRVYDYRGHPL